MLLRALFFAAASSSVLLPALAEAADKPPSAQAAIAKARAGRCPEAASMLESRGELNITGQLALADCYAAKREGDLKSAVQVLERLLLEDPARLSGPQRVLMSKARMKLKNFKARLPTLALVIEPSSVEPEIELDGLPQQGIGPFPLNAGKPHTVIIRAPRHEPWETSLTLKERERRELVVALVPTPDAIEAQKRVEPHDAHDSDTEANAADIAYSIGGRTRLVIVPKFAVNWFGEGGKTFLVPGGALSFSRKSPSLELRFSLAYASYAISDTPYLPKGGSLTDYEIISSDLMSLGATAEAFWTLPLNKSRSLRFLMGGGIGIGWFFGGDLYRSQAYEKERPGGGTAWARCIGPDEPAGTYEYCNAFDIDKDRYGNYAEPTWFDGGARPVIYPWVALPVVGLAWQLGPMSLQLEGALTISGFETALGLDWEL